jgi:hypothetical protein
LVRTWLRLAADSETAGVRRYWRDRSEALGIGSSAAVFSVLYHSLLKPLPYSDPQQLLFVHNFFFSPKNQVSAGGVSAFDYAEIRRHTDVFTSAGIFYWNDLTLTGLDDARHIQRRQRVRGAL